jgi:hypothetical protein
MPSRILTCTLRAVLVMLRIPADPRGSSLALLQHQLYRRARVNNARVIGKELSRVPIATEPRDSRSKPPTSRSVPAVCYHFRSGTSTKSDQRSRNPIHQHCPQRTARLFENFLTNYRVCAALPVSRLPILCADVWNSPRVSLIKLRCFFDSKKASVVKRILEQYRVRFDSWYWKDCAVKFQNSYTGGYELYLRHTYLLCLLSINTMNTTLHRGICSNKLF